MAYSLLVKMGTRNETPENAGISNMLQLMLVRGTEKMTGEQIAATADRLGGSIDAYGDYDYSEIIATALSRNWQRDARDGRRRRAPADHPDGTVTAVRDFVVNGRSGTAARSRFDVASDQTRIALVRAAPSLRLGPDRAQRVRAAC